MAKTMDKVSDMKPYVERALKDEDLRDNVLAAVTAARAAYGELLGDRGATGLVARVAKDDDIQDNLKKAVEELKEAADRLRGKKDHGSRNTMLLLTGVTLGILFNPMTGPQTRSWIKERVFGSDDDFTYAGGDSTESTPPSGS
jgi:hypothetical protein